MSSTRDFINQLLSEGHKKETPNVEPPKPGQTVANYVKPDIHTIIYRAFRRELPFDRRAFFGPHPADDDSLIIALFDGTGLQIKISELSPEDLANLNEAAGERLKNSND